MDSATHSESSASKTRGLVPFLLLAMVVLPGMGAAGILVWWLSRQSAASSEVAAIHAEIRSRGLPTDDATMAQFRLERLDQSRSRRWMDILDVVRSDDYRQTLDEFHDQVMVAESKFAKQLSRDTWLSRIDTVMTAMTTPSFTGFANAYLRSAMELRMAKVAIGCRLFHDNEGHWPAYLKTLNASLPNLDLGPIRPVGPNPFGYRIEESGALTLWGFPIETHDQTPEQPIEPAADASVSRRNQLRHLHWQLIEGDDPQ